MDLTAERKNELYALADGKADDIERECTVAGYSGRCGKAHRDHAVDFLVAAFEEEIDECGDTSPSGIQLDHSDVLARAQQMRKDSDRFGFIETLLIMIALNLIAKVIVKKLLEWWND